MRMGSVLHSTHWLVPVHNRFDLLAWMWCQALIMLKGEIDYADAENWKEFLNDGDNDDDNDDDRSVGCCVLTCSSSSRHARDFYNQKLHSSQICIQSRTDVVKDQLHTIQAKYSQGLNIDSVQVWNHLLTSISDFLSQGVHSTIHLPQKKETKKEDA